MIGPFKINRPAFGDALVLAKHLPDESVNCIVTSPPYWGLRDYGVDGQMGLEQTPEAYTARMVELFREIRRALKKDGTAWVNLGDSYTGSGNSGGHGKQDTLYYAQGLQSKCGAGLKPKDLVGIPWRVAFALQADGWYLRSDIIWAKPNPMPESVTDRPTKAHEYVFLLSKSVKYYYDADAVREDNVTFHDGNYFGGVNKAKGYGTRRASGNKYTRKPGRNKRSVWTVPTQPYGGAHFATFPPGLIKPCILAGCPEGGIVLDPFLGSGTTGMVCQRLGRKWIGFELNREYEALINKRIAQQGLF